LRSESKGGVVLDSLSSLPPSLSFSPPPTTFESSLFQAMSLPKRIIKVSSLPDGHRVYLSLPRWPIRAFRTSGELTSASPSPSSLPSPFAPSLLRTRLPYLLHLYRPSSTSCTSPNRSFSRLVVLSKPNDFSPTLLLGSPPLLMRRTSGISTS